MLTKNLYDGNTSLTGFTLVFNQKNLTYLHITSLYRGDKRSPHQIFTEGFKPRGNHLNVIRHLTHNDGKFVSTSYSKRAAKRYPKFLELESKHGFVYDIAPQREAINVNELLKPAEKSGKLKGGSYKFFAPDYEMAIPKAIRPQDIKGAWLVEYSHVPELIGSPLESSSIPTVRTIKSYISNPNYVPSLYTVHFSPSNTLAIARLTVKGLTAIGLSMEAYNLYCVFQIAKKTGDYEKFYSAAKCVAGGLAGAWAVGTTYAKLGVVAGAPLSPYGPPIAGFVSGIVGAAAGYIAGKRSIRQVNISLPSKLSWKPRRFVDDDLSQRQKERLANIGKFIANKLKPIIMPPLSLPHNNRPNPTPVINAPYRSLPPLISAAQNRSTSYQQAPLISRIQFKFAPHTQVPSALAAIDISRPITSLKDMGRKPSRAAEIFSKANMGAKRT